MFTTNQTKEFNKNTTFALNATTLQGVLQKTSFIISILILSFSSATGQNCTWKGVIIDQESGETLPGAIVEVHETHEKKASIDGTIHFVLKEGTYHIHARMLGYEPYAKTIKVKGDQQTDTLKLFPTSFELPVFMLESEYLKTEGVKSAQDIVHVSEDELWRRNEGNFASSLERIPGISAINVGVGVAKPMIRGMAFNRIQVNEGGVKQEGQQWAADHGLELDQYNMERVEIIKGPAAVLFGSDGMGGVINILPPIVPEENKIEADLADSYKSNNHFFGGTAGFKMNLNNFFVIARSSYKNFGDFSVPADEFTYQTFVLPIRDGRLKNTTGREFNNYISVGKLSKWGNIRFNYSRFSQDVGFFAGAVGRPQYFDLNHNGDYRNIELPYQNITHHKATFNLNANVNGNWLRIDGGFQNNLRREFSFSDAHSFRPLNGDTLANFLDLKTFTLNTRFYHNASTRWRFIYGHSGQFMMNKIDGFEFIIPEYTSLQNGVYAFSEWHITEDKTLSTGVRYDHAIHSSEAYSEILYNSQIEPIGTWERAPQLTRNFNNFSATVGLALEPTHHIQVKFNLGRAFRIPTLPELTANGVHHGTFRHEQGNIDLKPEQGTQLDVFLQYHNKKVIMTLTPFASFYENYIFLRPQSKFSPLPDAGQLYGYEEAPVVHGGGEFRIEYHPFSFLHLKYDASYVASYNINSGYHLPFIPPFNTSLSIEGEWERSGKKLHDLFFELELRYYAEQNFTDINEPKTPDALLINTNLGFLSGIGKLPFQVIFSLRNILNQPYFNHLSRYRMLNIPEPGFNFMTTLRFPLEFKIKPQTKRD